MLPRGVTLAVALMAGVSFAGLHLQGSHPALQHMVVRADANPSAFNMEDDSSQVAVPVGSLDAAGVHSLQKPSGDVVGNLSAAAGSDGQYGF